MDQQPTQKKIECKFTILAAVHGKLLPFLRGIIIVLGEMANEDSILLVLTRRAKVTRTGMCSYWACDDDDYCQDGMKRICRGRGGARGLSKAH